MQRIYIFLSLLFACIFIINPLMAIASQDKQDVKNNLRILELLPNLLCPLAVDPGAIRRSSEIRKRSFTRMGCKSA